ncbi:MULTISPECIES: heat-inducible transcriptional repressor HrcA [Saccharibacillus]|uniref:Heat-inducible transcriptional repressor HrcA n=2 Tax=Saccharibacillus TaxID=456492 RepID=A0ACC6PB84_9BACL|nr:heat-inducible transcriptional repressor HrcA [Saccharibacillus endophyticus]GGH74375.1 heat-inducible transcription repressor HrcA [Saccharibacillus endophyticus]
MLSERQSMILNAIVDDYIRSAEPVGSRSISKRGDVAFSPATIRNEMADLEELGFLEQPHTSAGRIPSNKGYRYYVDHMAPLKPLKAEDLKLFKQLAAEKLNAVEEVVQHAGTILASMTNYTSILLGPEMFNTSLKHFQLLPLNETTAVAIIVTSTGEVENKTVSIPPGVSASDMERTANLLNAKLSGVPMHMLKARIYSEIGQEIQRHAEHYEQLMKLLDDSLVSGKDQKVFLSGTTNMLIQPEFRDIGKLKTVLDLLEETPTLTRLLNSEQKGIHVRIGSENIHQAFVNCSLITATYSLDGESFGTIGILGPTRMEYAKVIGTLDLLSRAMSRALTGRYGP